MNVPAGRTAARKPRRASRFGQRRTAIARNPNTPYKMNRPPWIEPITRVGAGFSPSAGTYLIGMAMPSSTRNEIPSRIAIARNRPTAVDSKVNSIGGDPHAPLRVAANLWLNADVFDVGALPGIDDLERAGRRFDHGRIGEFAAFRFQVRDLLPALAVVRGSRQADRRAGQRRRVVYQ